jgi:hypothetical protein
MPSIESAVRAMLVQGSTLSGAGVPDAQVTHAYRLQSTDLPAVTFEISSTAPATTDATLNMSELEVRVIAETTLEASSIATTVESLIVANTYDTLKLVPIRTSRVINAPTVGLGDEQEPAEATVSATILWS